MRAITSGEALPARICRRCNGRGMMPDEAGAMVLTCARCSGKGYTEVVRCRACGGSGTEPVKR